jgi:hypothetical protein
VRFNERLHGFARYWVSGRGLRALPGALPKGKDERGVGYVKHNAIAGRRFDSWAALEGHARRVDARDRRPAHPWDHGRGADCAVRPREAAALRPLDGRPPFDPMRDLIRRVKTDATVEVDTNSYSVPWRLIGETVAGAVTVAGGRISVRHGGGEVASHGEIAGRRQRVMAAAHLEGDPRPGPAAVSGQQPAGGCAGAGSRRARAVAAPVRV